MIILLINAGSSSLKCSLMDAETARVIAHSVTDWSGATTHRTFVSADKTEHREDVAWKGYTAAVERVLADLVHVPPIALSGLAGVAAVGHRVVHGGTFTTSVRVTPEIRGKILALEDLAPLHNPPSLEALAAAEQALPNVPHVAVFDTAFHANLPPASRTYPLPGSWTCDWGIRRFGFHGLSYAYCSQRAEEMLGSGSDALRLVICHLGHGCSAAAVRNGQSIDTTMGFTPLEGLMMATRCGSIDPGIVLHVQQHHDLNSEQVEWTLNHEAGLLGVSGISADMRRVLAAAREGNKSAGLAIDVYAHRVRQAIGALAVTLGGVDALVFTAGVGEHAAEIRAAIAPGLECLGLEMDTAANAACRPDVDIATRASRGRILVIATREDLTMLREVTRVLETSTLRT